MVYLFTQGRTLGKKMSGKEKSDETNAGERLLGKGDLDYKRLHKAVVKETIGKGSRLKMFTILG
jgi:hypothetical protein